LKIAVAPHRFFCYIAAMLQRIDFYDNYREYLRDYYEDCKKKQPYFSYRYFCRKAGLTSPSHLKEVIQGKRKLTSKNIEAFAKGLGLNETDAGFFRALVHFNQSSSSTEKRQYLDQMRGLRRRVSQTTVPIDRYEYYTTWYHVVLRELACLTNWKDDYRLLARLVNPSITAAQAREGIKFLLDTGFLRKNETGDYEQSAPAITSGSEVIAAGVRSFNRLMANRGAEAIDQFSPTERDIQSLVVGISAESYRLIKMEMQEFLSRIVRIVDDDKKADQVFNLNIQFFPLSERASE
jgi:uncharacterized protein (TIGR02147 family)